MNDYSVFIVLSGPLIVGLFGLIVTLLQEREDRQARLKKKQIPKTKFTRGGFSSAVP